MHNSVQPHHPPLLDRSLSIAPMMDWTDSFFRTFLRIITQNTLLYTEMITTWALLNGDPKRLLDFNPIEHPVALQLGGHDPKALAQCAALGANWSYDEINLNLGCPSDRVSAGRFGACLMADADLVADCIRAMQEAVSIPITVKHRIGIDGWDQYETLQNFVNTLAQAGCKVFIVHARQAWLNGLSPKENRTIPPLRYDIVYRLKTDFPQLQIILNGGITNLNQAINHLPSVDGIMIGRAAYQDPWILSTADQRIFGTKHAPSSRKAVITAFLPHIDQAIHAGIPLNCLTRHLMGIFQGIPGSRAWRSLLSSQFNDPQAKLALIYQALANISDVN